MSNITTNTQEIPKEIQQCFFKNIEKGNYNVVKNLVIRYPKIVKCYYVNGNPLLYTAIYYRKSDIEKKIVELLIDKGVELNDSTKRNKITPLIYAIELGYDDIVKLLESKGAKITVEDSPLHFVVCNMNSEKLVQYILDKTPSGEKERLINSVDEKGNSALYYAVKADRELIAKFLIQNGAKIDLKNYNDRLFHVIAGNLSSNKVLAELLFNTIPEEQRKKFINAIDKSGNTALHMLFLKGIINVDKISMLEFLLKNGINPNIQDIQGNTPLHLAVKSQYLWKVFKKLLYQTNADFGIANNKGETPLHIVMDMEIEFRLKTEIEEGGNGYIAKDFKFIDLVLNNKNLKLYNLNIDQKRLCDQKTILMLAAEKGYLETVQQLIKLGANVMLTDNAGKTAGDLAQEAGFEKTADVLIKIECEVKKKKWVESASRLGQVNFHYL